MPAASNSASSESATVAAAALTNCYEVCLVAPCAGFTLVSCGHALFCESCARVRYGCGMLFVVRILYHGNAHFPRRQTTRWDFSIGAGSGTCRRRPLRRRTFRRWRCMQRQRYTAILITLQILREISIFLFADDIWCVTPFLQLTD